MRRGAALGAAVLVVASLAAASPAEEPSARPPVIASSAAVQMRALQAIKAAKSPAQAKIDSRLYLAVMHERNDARLASLADFRFVKPEGDGRVPVDIVLARANGMKPVLQKLELLGAVVRAESRAYRRISARVPHDGLETLAAMPEVRRVRQAIPALTHAVNTSEGDLTHGAREARAFFGVTGAGVKVGVISNGVDSLASLQASGDLPAVQVLPGQAGAGDEGSAMLEIVHDLAPGAALAFATANPDEATFAQNILDLAAAGCNVIVDDVVYLDESPFEDGPAAQAVNSVTAAGVLYFSSAGNEGNKADATSGTWEGDFNANGTLAPLAGAGPVHNFGDGGQSILVSFGGANPPLLVWAEHYDLATGAASTDYDLYDMDGGLTTIFDASTDTQDGVGGDDFPVEFIGGGTFSGERLVVARPTAGATSSAPMFNLIVFRGRLDAALTTTGATRGHSGTAAAFSVAATPAAHSFDGLTPDGPFPGPFTAANASESFTSDGPRRIILDPTGVELTPGNRTSTGGILRQKPDVTAADGVATATPGFDPFYGTSAAAPHAAAIAALLKSAVPGLTPAQARTALVSTAIDIEAPGVDVDTGAGIVMAHAALQAAGAAPGAFLTAGTAVPTQVMGDGDAFVEPNEVWNLALPLSNGGIVGAADISAVLTSSTPGVTISAGTSAYPDLAASATGNNVTPFTFTVGGTVPCGGVIRFALTVAYTGGTSPQIFDYSFALGAPQAPVTFSYTGAAVPIADAADLSGTAPGAPALADLPVAGVVGSVSSVQFRIDGTSCSAAAGSTTVGLDHTFVNDLKITLRSPSSTAALVINQTDGSGNNFCQTALDDESGGPSIQSVVTASAPFTGSFKPNVPLSTFAGDVANGTWQLQAQDFFAGDSGNIRAFSVVLTTAVCNAPPLTTAITGTKTVSGSFVTGSTVTYIVDLTNRGGLDQADNPGHELTDVLPPSLTLVAATASSGTAVATIGTNTVTWDGPVAALGGSVTIGITAVVNPVPVGTIVSNQGTISFDSDGNGTNESAATTDDPSVGGANDPTSFTVQGVVETATKTVAGNFGVGGTVTYTVTIANTGNAAAADNPGNELTDVLPSGLTLVSATASSGTAVATIGTNTVTWNGGLAAGASVTITIDATINGGTAGTTITNQGTIAYDADSNGTNETTTTTDDPAVGGANDPTSFVVNAGSFFTVAACRALDTRSGMPIAAGDTLTVTLTGAPCALPATATAVSLNVTVTESQTDGHVTLYPADEPLPGTSTLNFRTGLTRANNAVVTLAADGSITVLNASGGTIHLVIDLTGYFE
jgi:uncharacterized repeat protein (TIGR01451 family)